MSHYYGARLIEKLQHVLDPLIPGFEFISLNTISRITFYFLFPIIFFVNPLFGLTVLWAAVITEALNIFLKALIQGDRPYWWVKENAHKFCRIDLKQFPTTCEAGSGTPSSNVFMMTSVLVTLYLIWSTCCPYFINKKIVKAFILLLLFLLSVGRIVVGAHFPHQVILSIILGNLVARVVVFHEMHRSPPIFYFKCAAFFLIADLITRYIFPDFKMCGCWSILKQRKYCENPTFIPKSEIKSFVSYLELASILAGAGLSILIHVFRNSVVNAPDSVFYRIVSSLMCLIVTSIIYFKGFIENPSGITDYIIIILKNMIVPLIVIVFVPMLSEFK